MYQYLVAVALKAAHAGVVIHTTRAKQHYLAVLTSALVGRIVIGSLFTTVVHGAVPSVHDMSIEDCSSEEEYLSCGWCEPSCSNPNPVCSTNTCVRGCLCRPPLLRHYSGQCVEQKDCVSRKCSNSNEEFVCRYGCEARCDHHRCVRPRRCVLGCHCKIGYLRDTMGQCVIPEKCYKTSSESNVQNTTVVPQTIHNEEKL